MSNYVKEAESFAEKEANQMGSGNNQSGGGQNTNTSQSTQQQQQQSGGGHKTEDMLVDSAIDQVASREGLPAGFDPEVNNLVNSEVNKW